MLLNTEDFCKVKIFRLLYKIYEMLIGADKAKALRILQQQRKIISDGIEMPAEVMNVSLLPKNVGRFRQVRLSLRLRKGDDCFIYTSAKALTIPGCIPESGQQLRVKFLPHDLSTIVLV